MVDSGSSISLIIVRIAHEIEVGDKNAAGVVRSIQQIQGASQTPRPRTQALYTATSNAKSGMQEGLISSWYQTTTDH